MAVPDGTENQHLIAEAAEWLVAVDAGSARGEAFETWRSAVPKV